MRVLKGSFVTGTTAVAVPLGESVPWPTWTMVGMSRKKRPQSGREVSFGVRHLNSTNCALGGPVRVNVKDVPGTGYRLSTLSFSGGLSSAAAATGNSTRRRAARKIRIENSLARGGTANLTCIA